MTLQEMFDKIVDRLYDGSGQAVTKDVCQYRTPDGNKCVAGLFIPDGHPGLIDLNGVRITQFIVKYYGLHMNDIPVKENERLPDYVIENVKFLEDAQDIHDNSDNWIETSFVAHDKLINLAEKYRLEYDR